MTVIDADYYNRWYADMIRSPTRDGIMQRALGLPDHLRPGGVIGWEALAEVVALLDVRVGDTVLDLACGRGGYGMEVVRRTGVRMIGVDFSSVAIGQAEREAAEFGLSDRTEFQVADMADTGLDDRSVDAVICLDSIQFAESVDAVLGECRRVLRSGARIVMTGWQSVEQADLALRSRVRFRDLAVDLEVAGFDQVTVTERSAWAEAERAMWLAASTVEAGDDSALQAMRDESYQVLSVFEMRRRVLATALTPS